MPSGALCEYLVLGFVNKLKKKTLRYEGTAASTELRAEQVEGGDGADTGDVSLQQSNEGECSQMEIMSAGVGLQ